jgi:hypothetical protein
MRRKYTGTVRNKYGLIQKSAVVSVFLSGTTTPASIYTTWNGVSAVNSMLSDTEGRYTFYVDAFDYNSDQTFKIICTKGTATISVDNITIEDAVLGTYTISANKTVTTGVKVPQGVIFSVNTGVTLTFSGSFEAGLYQVFTGAGTVKFGNATVKEVPEVWFATSAKALTAVLDMTWPTVYRNVTILYGTGDPPSAATVPEGTLYLKYS